jgi:hypothetical protein
VLLLLLLFLSFDGDEEEDARSKPVAEKLRVVETIRVSGATSIENGVAELEPLIWGTTPPPLLLMMIFVRGEHFRALLLQKQQRRENKFLVVVFLVVVSSITFAPLKFLPQNNSRIFLSLLFVTSLESKRARRGVEKTREKKSILKIHEHTYIILIKERFEIQHTQIQCLSYGATIACTRRKRDARVCAEVLCAIRYILNPF